MVGKAKAHTKEDKERFRLLNDIGCLPCRMRGLGHQYGDIHHILHAGKRQSHQHTICLCKWHHVGAEPNVPDKVAEEHKGPSLAKNKRAFYNEFGSEEELLEATNQAIEIVKQNIVGK